MFAASFADLLYFELFVQSFWKLVSLKWNGKYSKQSIPRDLAFEPVTYAKLAIWIALCALSVLVEDMVLINNLGSKLELGSQWDDDYIE